MRTPRPGDRHHTSTSAWNALFVSAYSRGRRRVSRANAPHPAASFAALHTLDRILAEAWDESKRGYAAPRRRPDRLEGTLDDLVFTAAALLDGFEATLDRRYFEIAERTMRLAVERYGDPEAGGFFDRAKDAAPMGGMDIRRKPVQDSPTPGANSVAVIALDRLYGLTGETPLSRLGRKNARSLRRPGPAVRTFRRDLWARRVVARAPLPAVVVLGAASDPQAAALEKTANDVYRFGKSVLRATPDSLAAASLAPALRETLPHLDAKKPQALVCVETRCFPPVSDPEKLKGMLTEIAAEAAG